MMPKSRADAARDVRMWSGLGLFIGFVFMVVAAVETFGAGTRAVPFALVGIGFMLGGIGARLQYLAPRTVSDVDVPAPAAPDSPDAQEPSAASDAGPESGSDDADWPNPPAPAER